jgi:hypothetical protein
MAEVVDILCALTAITCALLLGRAYLRTKTRLLLWSTLCFLFLAANNILLSIDFVILGDDVTLAVPRAVTSLIAIILLVFGLLWDAE